MTLRLREQERKVIILAVISLAAAVVCFGILESTGVIENSAIKVSGAFAGFLVAVWLFNRVWGPPGSLDVQAQRMNSPLVVKEIAKVLDLTGADPTDNPQRAPLTDYYLVRRTAENARLTLHYATSGHLVFEGSETHRQFTRWSEGAPHLGIDGSPFGESYDLEVDLSSVSEGQLIPITMKLTYENAFTKPMETLETHLEYPTGWLSMFIVMPNAMRCTSAAGFRSIGRGKAEPLGPAPVVMHDGGIVYWSVKEPRHGAAYQVRWEWEPRDVR